MKLQGVRFGIVPLWVAEALKGPELALYVYLSQRSNDEGYVVVPRRELATWMNCSINTVDRRLATMRTAGVLAVDQRTDATGAAVAAAYRLNGQPGPSPTDPMYWGGVPNAGEEGTSPLPAVGPSPLPAAPTTKTQPKPNPTGAIAPVAPQTNVTDIRGREPDLLFEALYEVWIGKPYPVGGPADLTPAARGKLNAAAAQLRQAGATVEQVRQVPSAWALLWQGGNPPTFTPSAAVQHWPALVAAIERGYVARAEGSNEAAAVARLEQAYQAARKGLSEEDE